MSATPVYIWKKAPFIRLLVSLVIGIQAGWQFHIRAAVCWWMLSIGLACFIIFFFIPVFHRFRSGFATGIAGMLIFSSIGAFLVWSENIRNQKNWFGKNYDPQDALVVILDEPLVEKPKSFKADAIAEYIVSAEKCIPVKGNIILYFKSVSDGGKKIPWMNQLQHGTRILMKKPVQEIRNAGNPGEFDYKRSSLFRGFTHQVFLDSSEFIVLPGNKGKWLDRLLYRWRDWVLHIIRKNVKGEKERGLAEALLIGYKADLDPELVQSYTHTGVVHIIAISGLHIGLIYWLLLRIFRPLGKRRRLKWLKPVLIITCLWLFSLLAGAQPSVLRSAVMFTCIALGETLEKRSSVYNNLALSAFLLLCFNPFWLWDIGFQLSYSAVLSIIIFQKSVYNWFFFQNKFLDQVWKLNAVSISAQILTTPLGIYHFHQFPNYFLLTNLVAVPLSSLVVLGEIFLCAISIVPLLAAITGKLLSLMIHWMNVYVERIESMPFSLWNGLQITIIQTVLLELFMAATSYWLMERSKMGLKTGLLALFAFFTLRTYSFIRADRQQKIIIYNIPQHSGIDLVSGRTHSFLGDSGLILSPSLQFRILPSQIVNRLDNALSNLNPLIDENFIAIRGKHIIFYNRHISFSASNFKPAVDLLLISGRARLDLSQLDSVLNIKRVVFDSTVPAWKLKKCENDCDSLHIPYHDVNAAGAFVMNLN